jgi:hypothetical protein
MAAGRRAGSGRNFRVRSIHQRSNRFDVRPQRRQFAVGQITTSARTSNVGSQSSNLRNVTYVSSGKQTNHNLKKKNEKQYLLSQHRLVVTQVSELSVQLLGTLLVRRAKLFKTSLLGTENFNQNI